MTTMIKNLFSCCENTLENKNNEIYNKQSNEKGIINDEKNDKIKTCNTNSKNSNNNKEETNQKRYSFISNITSNSKENQIKINENDPNKKNDIFYININSSFKENKNCINSKNPQFTTLSILNNEKKDNLNRRISLTQMNDGNNNKNPFFLDSRFLTKNHSLENSKTSYISLSSISEKSNELKGIIIENKFSDGNLTINNHINDEEIELAPKLILKDLKSSNLFNGKIIKIDASGYKNSLRGKKDGKTYFGIKNNFDKKENDIIINIYDKKIKNNPLFVIFYDKNKTRYFIQYLNNDFNNNKLYMTIRIYNELFINKDEIRLLYLILGKILITLSIGENDDLCFKIYKNSISSNIENRRILEYNFKISDSPITIGREKCSILIENNFISRVHTTFIYGNNNKWCLIDGNEKRRHSTHGTWIILNNNIFELNPMNENYEVKIGEQAFNIHIKTE